MITLECADGTMLNVEEGEALQLQLHIDKIEKTNNVVQLPTSGKIMTLVIKYCESPAMGIDAEFFRLDEVTLLNLIQAAHHFKNKNLMDQTCQTLVNRVKEIIPKYDINQEYDQAPKRMNRFPGSDRLRSHSREAFIDKSNGVDLGDFSFDFVRVTKALFSMTMDPILDKCVTEFLESSNFLVIGELSESIKDLCLTLAPNRRSSFYLSSDSELPVTSVIKKLSLAIKHLHDVIVQDQGLADLLTSEVASRLVLILKRLDFFDIKLMAARILSYLSFSKCSDVIEEAVPVLLETIFDDIDQVAVEAALTLARLAFASSKWIHVSHFQGVKKGVQNAVTKQRKGAGNDITLFLVFVCRGNDLTLFDKVKVVLPILEHIFSMEGDFFLEQTLLRACYALSYLTFAADVKVEPRTCKRLMELISHKSISVAGSALGVVGNIVRWGDPRRIQWLVKDCKLMQCLGQIVLRSQFEKIQMEGCRIISNIAARSEIYKMDMDEAGLTPLLCSMLETDKSDLKMEATWAVFNMHYNVMYKNEYIDNYEKDIVMSAASEINLEVEHERSGLTTALDNEVEKEREVGMLRRYKYYILTMICSLQLVLLLIKNTRILYQLNSTIKIDSHGHQLCLH